MSLLSRANLLNRVRRSKESRKRLVDSNLSKGIAYQIKAMRDAQNITQADLARESGMTPNNLSRLESPDYGKQTISSLKRIADALDVAIVVRFVPFSQYIDWLSGTTRFDEGLTAKALAVPSFNEEEEAGLIEESQFQKQVTQMALEMTVNIQFRVEVLGVSIGSTSTPVMYQPLQTPHVFNDMPQIDKQLEAGSSLQQPFIAAKLNQSNLEENHVNA
jgi:transcriptional regulator with XRE-family HTH domain